MLLLLLNDATRGGGASARQFIMATARKRIKYSRDFRGN